LSPGPTFQRVYRALRDQLRSGQLGPGEQLEPAVLAEALATSMTPVRDALHRLAGERLVETPRLGGFRVPLLTEGALRHLYGWNADLLLLALRSAKGPPSAGTNLAVPEPMIGGLAAATAELFTTIGRLSDNPEHGSAIALLCDRMAQVRRIEPVVLDHVDEELAQLGIHLGQADFAGLRRAIPAYHRRRRHASPRIVEALHAGAAAI
jgi:DNA-binding transcriptional MocR family regulator